MEETIIKVYEYEKNNQHFKIKTERYGVAGFNIYITATDYKAYNVEGFIPFGKEDVIMATSSFLVDGRRFGIKPPCDVMKEILIDRKAPTKESLAYAEQKRKEREWDNIWNEGGEGFNPYRTGHELKKEPFYKGDEFHD